MRREGHIKPISFVLWGVLLLIMAAIVLLRVFPRPEKGVSVPEEKEIPVRVYELASRPVEELLVLPGRFEPWVTAHLAAEKSGRVVEVAVDKGTSVTNGQVLLRVDDREWVAMLRQAKIERREAEKELRRLRDLQETGAVSVQDLDAVRTRFDLSEVALDAAEMHVSRCVVKSPTDGIVEARRVEPGEYVKEGTVVFVVIDMRRTKLVVEVAERDIRAVKAGGDVPFRVAAVPGQTFTGRVSFVASMGSRESNSFRTELAVPNPDNRFKAGMIAEVSLVRRTNPDAIVLPLAAVLKRGGDHVVFAVEDGRAVRRVVQIDTITGHEAVLSSGVKAGDRIVVEGHRGLQDGTRVAVAAAADETEAE